MGKKKNKTTVDTSNPDSMKDAGNKAFLEFKFVEAVNHYTMAIETSEEPNHIYYANRANAYLEIKKYPECISDCDKAIEINKTFVKSYMRKAKAQVAQENLQLALETLDQAILADDTFEEFKSLHSRLTMEIADEKKMPADHPERKKFKNLVDWVKGGGGVTDKLKLCYNSNNVRGLKAACDITSGETVLEVPEKFLIHILGFKKTSLYSKMHEAKLTTG